MSGRYRKYETIYYEGIEDFKDDQFVLKSEMDSTLDNIESCVNNIMSLLEDVKGLDLIDSVKDELKELSSNLY